MKSKNKKQKDKNKDKHFVGYYIDGHKGTTKNYTSREKFYLLDTIQNIIYYIDTVIKRWQYQPTNKEMLWRKLD